MLRRASADKVEAAEEAVRWTEGDDGSCGEIEGLLGLEVQSM